MLGTHAHDSVYGRHVSADVSARNVGCATRGLYEAGEDADGSGLASTVGSAGSRSQKSVGFACSALRVAGCC